MTALNSEISLPAEVKRIGEALRAAGGRPVLVGGWVRDWLLGDVRSKDFDLEVFGLEPAKLRKVLAGFGPVHAVGRKFGVLKLSTPRAEYDVGVPRRESKIGKGHKGFWVEADPDMSFPDAAGRRDFTINAMGYAYLDRELLDPYEGRRDLEARMLRHVGPAFGEDPLRVMRAMQFAGRFALTIAPETLAICREQDLAELPRERMWEEFKKLLLRSPRPSRGFAYAGPLGILPYFPELERLAAATEGGAEAAWDFTMATLDRAARLRDDELPEEAPREGLALMLAALCHGFGQEGGGEAAVRGFLDRLTNETGIIEPVVALVREHAQPDLLHAGRETDTDSAVRRLALRVSIPSLERLARARHLARLPDAAPGAAYPAGEWLLQRAAQLGVRDGPPQALLKGRHLQAEGFAAGPAMGRLLKQAFELQLEGKLNSVEEALAWARQALAAASGPESTPGEAP